MPTDPCATEHRAEAAVQDFSHGFEELVQAERFAQRCVSPDGDGCRQVVKSPAGTAACRHGDDPGLRKAGLAFAQRLDPILSRHEAIVMRTPALCFASITSACPPSAAVCAALPDVSSAG
jgi:hypothetical protein